MQLFDAHCHLQDDRLLPHLDTVMERAATRGVAGMMCCGSSEADWPQVQALAQRFTAVRTSFGLHPWYVGERSPEWLGRLRECLKGTPSAVGEIGLDHALEKSTYAAQETVFLAQLDLARELHRPISFHCRRAWGRMMELLEERGWPAQGFMFHSYSGSAELVASLSRRGAFFSFSGSITFDAHIHGREALSAVPLDRLLIETDSPDIPPSLPLSLFPLQTGDGKPINEPAHLPHVLHTVAKLKGMTVENLADVTWNNAVALWCSEMPWTISNPSRSGSTEKTGEGSA